VKLIAEPWDVGDGGYQVGNFPVLWAEWNGKYRDCIRGYWKGEDGKVPEFASRLTGSSDLYNHDGKRPYASINFITAHDGFTMRDLVSYNEKHNEANGEANRDGDNNNASWNCGAEGETDDPEISRLRRRQMRNFFTTLLLSQGVPMLSSGDEVARTQHGNNNAYCQDNEISWFPWNHSPEQESLRNYVARLIRFRKDHPVFRRPKFFQGRGIRGLGIKDVMWVNQEGREMDDQEWENGFSRSIGVLFGGRTVDVKDERGQPVTDDTFVLLFNAHHETMSFHLPRVKNSKAGWRLLINTKDEDGFVGTRDPVPAGGEFLVCARSMAVFRHGRRRRGDGDR